MRRRRLALLVAALIAFLFGVALLYDIGHGAARGQAARPSGELEWAAETLSTTGYGADKHWSHPMMVVLVISCSSSACS